VGDADEVKRVFRGERRVQIQTREEEPAGRVRKARKGREALSTSPSDQPLFEALRAWRARAAKSQHVPPYVIFHDRTLAEIAATKPGSRAALGQVNGVGEGKLARYGDAVLEVVVSFAT
jgi:ATP-dependent DNA helicase RecQ